MSAHFRRIAPAELERLWADRSLTRAEIAARVGLSERALTVRVRRQGLALRGFATKKPCISDTGLFAEMWRAGVSVGEMAVCFDVDRRTIGNTRARLGLAPRAFGERAKVTAAAFLMERAAGLERARLVGGMECAAQ
jgi:hypothetical protein